VRRLPIYFGGIHPVPRLRSPSRSKNRTAVPAHAFIRAASRR
jgi:hypothetical protein